MKKKKKIDLIHCSFLKMYYFLNVEEFLQYLPFQ